MCFHCEFWRSLQTSTGVVPRYLINMEVITDKFLYPGTVSTCSVPSTRKQVPVFQKPRVFASCWCFVGCDSYNSIQYCLLFCLVRAAGHELDGRGRQSVGLPLTLGERWDHCLFVFICLYFAFLTGSAHGILAENFWDVWLNFSSFVQFCIS